MSVAVLPAAERRAAIGAHDRTFYSGIAIALAVTVFAGFGSTYFVPMLTGAPKATLSGNPFTAIVHLHGALFTAWVLLFVIQTALVAQRRVVLHRRLGILGGVLAACMVIAGTTVAVAAGARGAAPPGVDPLVFMIVPLADMVLFALFVTLALFRRRDREAHKRLMLMAYVSIVAAATARLPGVLPLGPFVFFGMAFMFAIAGAVYDWVTRRRVHAAYVWGGALFAISVPLRLALSGTAAWHAFAVWLTR